MSAVRQENKIRIAVDSASARILVVRKSGDTDFRRAVDGITEFEISTDQEPPPLNEAAVGFSLAKGFFELEMPLGENDQIDLLKKKMAVLGFLRSNMQLTKNAIDRKFSDATLASNPLPKEHFYRFWVFMRAERETLIDNILNFEKEVVRQLNNASTVSAVDDFYSHVVNNINVGIYSVINPK